MTFDVDAAAARHQPSDALEDWCCCGQPWPCDAAQALDVIYALRRFIEANEWADKMESRGL